MAYTEALHKRGTGAQGGQFVTKGAGGQTTKTSSIGYSGGAGKGTGYGAKGGDPNVKSLQTELNRLGILDAQGKQLKVDGKFGPKTTAAVRRLQARLGMSVDGRITPALLSKIKKLKPSQHDQHVMHQRHLGAQHKQHVAHQAHQKTAAKQHQAHTAHQAHAAHQKTAAAKKPAPVKARTGMGPKPRTGTGPKPAARKNGR
jgi:peptidoglycan hydrolase-like protein with peptidoglycan-binding domain